MKLTKYEHACFTVEKDGKLLVVDPGGWTNDLAAPENVVGIVVTHEHADHFDVNALGALIGHNPEAQIFAHESITRQIAEALPSTAVVSGEGIEVGPFKLEFYGGEHALIHPDIPPAINLAVMINGKIYHPGDSFTNPDRAVEVLALPVSAPWMKMSEALDFMMEIKPLIAFPTHDAILSDSGKSLADNLSGMFAEKANVSYQRLHQPLEIDE
jgi:L-ascorbate metabolism protein UlaG (beta-lactamase superfamily)